MDVVVRTPHGDANIDIVAAPAASTLADLIHAVTGQATPTIARIDGRTVPTSRPIVDLALAIGSVIETRPIDTQQPGADAADNGHVGGIVANLLQLAGRGAGTVLPLRPGRYRIGTARRLHAPEMDRAHVDAPAFEIEVGDHGKVVVHPSPSVLGSLGPYSSRLGSASFGAPTTWNPGTSANGDLSIGGRVFRIETPPVTTVRRPLPRPEADGSIPFQRSPALESIDRPLVVGAVRAATEAGPTLWHRRRSDETAYDIPFGMSDDGVTPTSVDLTEHRGVAIVGSERFGAALARTMLIEAATLHGPADLSIVIASSPDHVATWSWARWLPHTRRGGPGSMPDMLSDSASLAAWANSVSPPLDRLPGSEQPEAAPRPSRVESPSAWNPPTTAQAEQRLTLLVLDDVALWSRRDSPIRTVITNPPPGLRIMALCVGLHEAPGLCTTLIEEVPPATHLSPQSTGGRTERLKPGLFGSLAQQHIRLGPSPHIIADIRPALMEPTLAAEVARQLAPLDDLEARHAPEPPRRMAAPTLTELVTMSEADTRGDALRVAIGIDSNPGIAGRRPTLIEPMGDRPTILAASDPRLHDVSVASLVLGASIQRPDGALAILVVGNERAAWYGELPHLVSWISHQDASDPTRLIHRVAHVLTERPDLDVLVIIEHAFASPREEQPIPIVTGMLELASALPNVGLVLTTQHANDVPDSLSGRAGTFAWISEAGDGLLAIDGATRQFTAATQDYRGGGPAASAAAASFDAPNLVIRPAAHGGSMTPLERRMSRSGSNDADVGEDVATAALARHITMRSQAGTRGDDPATLLPPPMPPSVDFTDLLDRHAGDGVPIGVLDRPERAEQDVYWWQPGPTGSLLAIGSPRSGMTALLDLLIVGIAARFSADDLHVSAIEALPQRRRALGALPHVGDVVSPDDADLVRRLVGAFHQELSARASDGAGGRPDLLLIVGDVGRVRRSLAPDIVDDVFDQLGDLAATGSNVGLFVVAVATRAADLGPLDRLTGDRLVGTVSEPEDRSLLGAPVVGPADRHIGRCWSTLSDRRVQLAAPPASVEHEIAVLAPEEPRARPPQAFVAEGSS